MFESPMGRIAVLQEDRAAVVVDETGDSRQGHPGLRLDDSVMTDLASAQPRHHQLLVRRIRLTGELASAHWCR
ncbi:hypothetical protein ABZ725_28840 [Streptomyces sp. NPDC006872]|uniref:hypothetical protein n=1 Tax=Streptomyces sp. NPDC006872 TaxID=3155720 RepID=UPI00340EEFED